MSYNTDQYRLWQHNNGTWYIIWSPEYGEKANSRGTKRISTGASDRRTAEQYRAQFIAGLKNETPKEEPIISYLLKRYRDEHGVNTRSLETIDYHLRKLLPFFGDLLPSHVSNNLLKEYVRYRVVKNGTILRELGTFKAALHYAEGNRWIERQPQFMMPVKSPPPRDVWLKREEVAMLIEKAKSPHIRLFIKIAVSTAARSGAILDLKWDQLNLESRIIDFGRGFGNKRRSVVPMNDVIEYNGRPTRAIKKAFSRLCEECGIKASPHALRHTAATWLVMDGVPLSEVARLLGDSEKTVETVYGKHSPDYLRRAVTALNLGSKTKPVFQL
jgi:integrase